MKNIYLYGASDDCHEIETDFDTGFESYVDIQLKKGLIARYNFGCCFSIWLDGKIPKSWKVKVIRGNAEYELADKFDAGEFIHIQVPDNTELKYKDVDYEEYEEGEERVGW